MADSAGQIESISRLTPTQEGILFHALQSADPFMYVGQYGCTLHAKLDPSKFATCWRQLTQRHAALRTFITWRGREHPLQVVRKNVDPDYVFEDAAADPERCIQLEAQSRDRGFQLEQAPLVRVVLCRLDSTSYRLSITYHHIIVDGWSMQVLLGELAALYSGEQALQEAFPFRRYVEWLLAQDPGAAEGFWRETLGDLHTPTQIVSGVSESKPEIQNASSHGRRQACIGETRLRQLATFARDRRITMHALFCAVWAIVTARCSDVEDVVFGTTFAGRPEALVGCERGVGLFINTLPVRLHVGDNTIEQFLDLVQQTLVGIRQHEHSSLIRAQQASNVPSGQALFESVVVYQSVPAQADAGTWETWGTWHRSDEQYLEHSNFPLALLLRPRSGQQALDIVLVFDRRRCAQSVAVEMMNAVDEVLDGITSQSTASISKLSLLSVARHRTLLELCTGPHIEGIEENLCQLIEQAAARAGSSAALVDADGALSYSSLMQRASVLAKSLPQARGTMRVYGCVALRRSSKALLAMMAVLKSGGTYVPLDPDAPPARLQRMLTALERAALASGGEVVVLTDCALDLPFDASRFRWVDMDAQAFDIEPNESSSQSAIAKALDHPAYVIHTSGSTGEAKGVEVSHRNIVHSVLARRHYYQAEPQRFLLLSSLATDSSLAGIFWALTSGTTLVLPPARIEQSVAELCRFIEEQRISHMLCLPSIHALLLEHGDRVQLRSLTCVIVAGEACSQHVVRLHRAHLPEVELHNEYGPSEASVWATAAQLHPREDDGPVTIGRPIATARAYVMNAKQELVVPGFSGELYIGGPIVALGYLGDEAMSASRFIPDPFSEVNGARMYRTGDRVRMLANGELEYLGRVDNQIKIRGYRIEPEEVMQALTALPGVREAAIVHAQTSRGGQLRAYLELKDELQSTQHLREALQARLPEYMIPQAFITVERMPRTAAGKIDYRALAVVDEQPVVDTNGPAPRNELEHALVNIWRDTLGVEQIGVYDNFFELGGDSLLSIRVLAKIHAAGFTLAPADFFVDATIAAHAMVIQKARSAAQKTMTQPPVAQPRRRAARRLSADSLSSVARQLKEADQRDEH